MKSKEQNVCIPGSVAYSGWTVDKQRLVNAGSTVIDAAISESKILKNNFYLMTLRNNANLVEAFYGGKTSQFNIIIELTFKYF